jgi:hypothetical protein
MLATRKVTPYAGGLHLTFQSGNRCTTVTVECSDVLQPQIVRFGHAGVEGAPCAYAGFLRARAGCALECARNENGEVCGGKTNGVCIAEQNSSGLFTRCECNVGYIGASCLKNADLKRIAT